MKISSITNSKQIQNMTERRKEKDKTKENIKPIMPYYVITNNIYSNQYNFQKNPKSFLHKKKSSMNDINTYKDKDINLNLKNSTKNVNKNNSTVSSYKFTKNNYISKKYYKNEINYISLENSSSVKDKILSNSKNKLNNINNNNNSKIKNKINFDYNFIMKKISNKNKQKSSHDIFYNETKNCYTLNSSKPKKKNKKMITTSLNSSKNSSQERIKINSKKRWGKINYKNFSSKPTTQGSQLNSNRLLLNNSSKCINSKFINPTNGNVYTYNSNNKNGKIYKKNQGKFIIGELYHPDKERHELNFYKNYLKGVNNAIINNSQSYKSISINSTGNISYNKPKINIGVSDLKNEFINKDNYCNLLSNPTTNNNINTNSSIISNNCNNPNKQMTAKSLSINTHIDKQNNGFSNIYSLNLKHSQKNNFNNKLNIKKILCQYQTDSPFYKYCHKTAGNYFSLNNTNNSSNKVNINYSSYNYYRTIKSPLNKNSILKKKINKDKNIKKNDNNKIIENKYNLKVNKIIKDSLQEISKIKNEFAKHFTSNNSPNHKNEEHTKRELETNNDNRENGNYFYPLKLNNNNYKSNKNLFNKKKIKFLKNSCDKKTSKNSPQKNNIKNKLQRPKLLTQNNSKKNIKKIKEIKEQNKKIQITKIEIPTQYQTNNQNLTNTSRSNANDSSYYLRESQKLSNFIKNYYIKNKKYPDTNLQFYKYGRLIGQGAFGKVNLGLNILTGRVVAIKSFNKLNLNSNSENMKKILYETNLMKKLNHPNITKILELFEDKEYILIIMEYINGGNLFSFLKKRRKVSEKTAKFLFKQIILGIKHIHSHNIVHRDIKLENILIDLNNNIKICDFGIGRVLSSPDQLLYDQCGTPMYIAPEILLCTKQNGYKGFPVDIWSSGIALYILLSGTLPFNFKDGSSISIEESEKNNDNNSEELQFNIVNNSPKNIENISDEARDLLKGLLNKNPNKRLTCDEILAHPWLKDVNENLDNNKYHLFTKAEMKMLSKTYVDYRKDKNDNLKENFTLSNLFNDDKNKKVEKNIETKSSILAPFNSIINKDEEDDFYFEDYDMEDLTNNDIKLENGIISIGHKVKEFNMFYEMNNNCEVDNGIMINSKTNTLTTISNNTINSKNNNSNAKNSTSILKEEKEEKGKTKTKNSSKKVSKVNKNKNNNNNKENIKEINKILDQLESLGYNKSYVKECVKNNVLCHASTAYFLMLNYDKV